MPETSVSVSFFFSLSGFSPLRSIKNRREESRGEVRQGKKWESSAHYLSSFPFCLDAAPSITGQGECCRQTETQKCITVPALTPFSFNHVCSSTLRSAPSSIFFFFFSRPVMVLNNSTVSCLYVSDMNFLFQHIHKANSSNRWRNIIDSLTFLLLDLVSYWHPASTCLSLLSYEFPNCDAKLGNWQSIRRWRMEGIESCNNPVQAWLLPWRFEFHKGLTSLLLALIKVIYAIFYGISSAACLNSVWGPVVPERCVCLYDKVGVDASLHQWGQRFITLGSLPESDFYSIAAFFSIPLLRQQAAVLSFKCINAPVICHLHQSHSLRKWK